MSELTQEELMDVVNQADEELQRELHRIPTTKQVQAYLREHGIEESVERIKMCWDDIVDIREQGRSGR